MVHFCSMMLKHVAIFSNYAQQIKYLWVQAGHHFWGDCSALWQAVLPRRATICRESSWAGNVRGLGEWRCAGRCFEWSAGKNWPPTRFLSLLSATWIHFYSEVTPLVQIFHSKGNPHSFWMVPSGWQADVACQLSLGTQLLSFLKIWNEVYPNLKSNVT